MRSEDSARAGIGGDVDDTFAPVLEAFRRNFSDRGEVGAAVTVVVAGRPVVDLWGGQRDTAQGLPWKRDTIVPVFSTSKGVSALVMASLVSRGVLDYDATVASYWPEFADHGKHDITVRQLFAHEAGVAVLDTPVRTAELAELDALAVLLARQKPLWRPGTKHGYHAITLGLYQNELARRVDPEHRTIGAILAADLAKPLGLRTYIGLPETIEMTRVAVLGRLDRVSALKQLPGVPWMLAAALANPRSATTRSLANPRMGAPERLQPPRDPHARGAVVQRGFRRAFARAALRCRGGRGAQVTDRRSDVVAAGRTGAGSGHDRRAAARPVDVRAGVQPAHPVLRVRLARCACLRDGRARGLVRLRRPGRRSRLRVRDEPAGHPPARRPA